MIRKENTGLSLTRQCKLLKISRSSIYYTPVGFDLATIDLMHEIDRIFTKYPFFGSRQIAAYLPQSGFSAGRHRVRRLMAIMDWATRKVLSWRLSNTLDASFCVEALKEAIAKYGTPEIMNTDQGSQYTGTDWITTLTKAEIKISMDGRGRYLDNIFIERLWRSLKQEAVYLHEITNGFQAQRIIDGWIGFYNSERPHTALDKRTPDAAYFSQTEIRKAA